MKLTYINALDISSINLFASDYGESIWKRQLTEFINPELSLSRSYIDFLDVQTGQFKKDTIEIRNNGEATLNVDSISSNSSVWRVSNAKISIPPNNVFIDTIIFSPNALGDAHGKFIIISNGLSSPDSISTLGTGTSNNGSWIKGNGCYDGKINSFAISGDNIFAATNGGVFLSSNNGKNWTAVNNGLTSLEVFGLAFIGTKLFAGTSGGVFVSTDNGNSWIAVNSGLTDTNVWSLLTTVSDNDTNGASLFAGY